MAEITFKYCNDFRGLFTDRGNCSQMSLRLKLRSISITGLVVTIFAVIAGFIAFAIRFPATDYAFTGYVLVLLPISLVYLAGWPHTFGILTSIKEVEITDKGISIDQKHISLEQVQWYRIDYGSFIRSLVIQTKGRLFPYRINVAGSDRAYRDRFDLLIDRIRTLDGLTNFYQHPMWKWLVPAIFGLSLVLPALALLLFTMSLGDIWAPLLVWFTISWGFIASIGLNRNPKKKP